VLSFQRLHGGLVSNVMPMEIAKDSINLSKIYRKDNHIIESSVSLSLLPMELFVTNEKIIIADLERAF
jgi:hypothetical protein